MRRSLIYNNLRGQFRNVCLIIVKNMPRFILIFYKDRMQTALPLSTSLADAFQL